MLDYVRLCSLYFHCILCCPNSETFLDLLLTDLSAKPIDLLPRSIPGVRCSDHSWSLRSRWIHSQPSVQRLTKIALLCIALLHSADTKITKALWALCGCGMMAVVDVAVRWVTLLYRRPLNRIILNRWLLWQDMASHSSHWPPKPKQYGLNPREVG